MYHHVNPHKGDMVTVSPDVFEAQMRFLKETGYRTLSADELIGFICGDIVIKEKAVLITFDDGYLDNYVYVFSVLKKYNIKATIFIVTDWVEKSSEAGVGSLELKTKELPNHEDGKRLINEGKTSKVIMNLNMIKEMQESGLVEFYSHTMSHKKCDQLSEMELYEELSGSKIIIEKRLIKTCQYLCWPYGRYNDTAVKIAKDTGHKALFTTNRGVVKAGSDPFAINRIVVKDSVAWFKKRMLLYTNSFAAKIYLISNKG
ncbi:MAG: polysaccharide deacetylase family protein [Deltaproteobacteria bacterium]|nr:polysaccharide deacetylase family protein [Deltaproteobacteria bacterium]